MGHEVIAGALRPWIETGGVVLLAMGGFGLGVASSRLRKPYWAVGYVIPLVVVGMISAARRVPQLEFVAPFSWLMSGRTEFVLLGVLTTVLLATPLSRLPQRSQRGFVVLFMVLAVVYVAVLPFLSPALIQGRLSRLNTRLTDDGVCLQGTQYTCGPAAAVSALRRLGIEAGEGELAILAHTSAFSGTQPDSLCQALRQRYADDGLECEYRRFASTAELPRTGATIALIKFGLMVDHYVAVLDVSDDEVTIGDPLSGRRTLSQNEFTAIWRKCGVVLRRRETPASTE